MRWDELSTRGFCWDLRGCKQVADLEMDFTGAAGDMNVIAMPSEKLPPRGVIPRAVWESGQCRSPWESHVIRGTAAGQKETSIWRSNLIFNFPGRLLSLVYLFIHQKKKIDPKSLSESIR